HVSFDAAKYAVVPSLHATALCAHLPWQSTTRVGHHQPWPSRQPPCRSRCRFARGCGGYRGCRYSCAPVDADRRQLTEQLVELSVEHSSVVPGHARLRHHLPSYYATVCRPSTLPFEGV